MNYFSEISLRFHWNISERILQHFSEISLKFQWNNSPTFQWNVTEISVKYHRNFSEMSLKFQWDFTEIRWNVGELFHCYFCDISLKFQWLFSVGKFLTPDRPYVISAIFTWSALFLCSTVVDGRIYRRDTTSGEKMPWMVYRRRSVAVWLDSWWALSLMLTDVNSL